MKTEIDSVRAFLLNQGVSVPNIMLEDKFLDDLELKGFELVPHEIVARYTKEINERYPSRRVVPFALSLNSDETACFVLGNKDYSIVQLHDFASAGWEQPLFFKSLSEWLVVGAK
ncbi:MAG: hypothetical protein AAFV31_05205 [Pseudomonadota bacterium]